MTILRKDVMGGEICNEIDLFGKLWRHCNRRVRNVAISTPLETGVPKTSLMTSVINYILPRNKNQAPVLTFQQNTN